MIGIFIYCFTETNNQTDIYLSETISTLLMSHFPLLTIYNHKLMQSMKIYHRIYGKSRNFVSLNDIVSRSDCLFHSDVVFTLYCNHMVCIVRCSWYVVVFIGVLY